MSKVKNKRDPLWLRSWRKRDGRFHVEIRDPKLNLRVVDYYPGDDHTYHIILEAVE